MFRLATILFLAIALLSGAQASAQLVDLSWNTIDGGGGRLTGGTFVVTGTIGQPEASTVPLTGGSYLLEGGFWPGIIPVNNCPANIASIGSSAGRVDIDDLLSVINAWGTCGQPCPPRCPADITGSACIVNIDELLMVINTWGPCP